MLIDWTAAPAAQPVGVPKSLPAPAVIADPADTLVQVLPWDFQSTFPPVLDEAIEAGTVAEEDAEPEALAAMHAEQAGVILAALRDSQRVHDARRRGVDPSTGKVPRSQKTKCTLPATLDGEIRRLDRWRQTLLETYEEAFGPVAAEAFDKYTRARHAGIEVRADTQPPPVYRVPELPSPTSLQSSVKAGVFGHDEQGRPIDPGSEEVEEITDRHAEVLTELLDKARHANGSPAEAATQTQVQEAVEKYAGDFGRKAADDLLAFCRRQVIRSPGFRLP